MRSWCLAEAGFGAACGLMRGSCMLSEGVEVGAAIVLVVSVVAVGAQWRDTCVASALRRSGCGIRRRSVVHRAAEKIAQEEITSLHQNHDRLLSNTF